MYVLKEMCNYFRGIKVDGKHLMNNLERNEWNNNVNQLLPQFLDAKNASFSELDAVLLAQSLFQLKKNGDLEKVVLLALEYWSNNVILNLLLARVLYARKDKKGYAAKYFWHAFILDPKEFEFSDLINLRECLYISSSYLKQNSLSRVDDFVRSKLIICKKPQVELQIFEFEYLYVSNRLHEAILLFDIIGSIHLSSQLSAKCIDMYVNCLVRTNQIDRAIKFIKKSSFYDVNDVAVKRKLRNLSKLLLVSSQIVVDQDGYKIVYYKQLNSTGRKVVVSFGALSTHLNFEPFGLHYLLGEGCDVIWVAQSANSFYNKLSFNAFKSFVLPITQSYEGVFTFGSSLGAYAALYFAGAIDATVIAASPRNPPHSSISIKEYPYIEPELHVSMLDNLLTTKDVFIVRDDKNTIDTIFYSAVVEPAYPKAKILNLSYAGHTVLETIRDAGKLSEFISSMLNDAKFLDVYDDLMKTDKFHYEKSTTLFDGGDVKGALLAINDALEIKEAPNYLIFKCEILRKLELRQDFDNTIKKAKELYPKNRQFENICF